MSSTKKIPIMKRLRNNLEDMILEHGFKKTPRKKGVYFRLCGEIVQVIWFDTYRPPVDIMIMASPYWSVFLDEFNEAKFWFKAYGVDTIIDKFEGHDDSSRHFREPSYRRWEYTPNDGDDVENVIKLYKGKIDQHIFPLLDSIANFDTWIGVFRGIHKTNYLDMHKIVEEMGQSTDIVQFFNSYKDYDVLNSKYKHKYSQEIEFEETEMLLNSSEYTSSMEDLLKYCACVGNWDWLKIKLKQYEDKIEKERLECPERMVSYLATVNSLIEALHKHPKAVFNVNKGTPKWDALVEKYQKELEEARIKARGNGIPYAEEMYNKSMDEYYVKWGDYISMLYLGASNEEITALFNEKHKAHCEKMKSEVQKRFDELKMPIIIK